MSHKGKNVWLPFQEMTPTNGELQDGQKMFRNNKYIVIVERQHAEKEGFADLIHLSIRTINNTAEHDWRDYQRIKNELAGAEIDFIERYPPESMLVDTVNQFHLYGIDDVKFRFPFGFGERLVAEGPYTTGAKQRPFIDKPADCRNGDDLEVLKSEL